MGESIYFDVCTSLILELLLFHVIRRENIEKSHPTVRWVCFGVFVWVLVVSTSSTVIHTVNINFIVCITYLGIWMIIVQQVNQILFKLINSLKSNNNYNNDHQEEDIDIIATTAAANTPPPPSYIELFPLSNQRPRNS